jgi:kynurenine formamidase
MIDNMRVVDLTQPLSLDTVMWPGAPAPTAEVILTVAHDGFYNRRVSFMEHSGTHFDAPCHMVDGATPLHDIDPGTLVRPAVTIDISAAIAGDADGALSLTQVHEFEVAHGRIADGSVALLRTGWEEFNRDAGRYAGAPGPLRFPGYGVEAARFLVDDRHVVGLGVDTLSIDLGSATDFPVHRQVSLPRGVWHLEGLTNLAALPPTGVWLFVGVLNLRDGSGSPARVLALVP